MQYANSILAKLPEDQLSEKKKNQKLISQELAYTQQVYPVVAYLVV